MRPSSRPPLYLSKNEKSEPPNPSALALKSFEREGKKTIVYALVKKEPPSDDPSYRKWVCRRNSPVVSWLIHSMEPEISRNYIFLDTAKEIWDAVSVTYSQIGNMAQVYELKRRIHEAEQGEKSVSSYFNMLQGLWKELDHYQNFQAECSDGCLRRFRNFLSKNASLISYDGLNQERRPDSDSGSSERILCPHFARLPSLLKMDRTLFHPNLGRVA